MVSIEWEMIWIALVFSGKMSFERGFSQYLNIDSDLPLIISPGNSKGLVDSLNIIARRDLRRFIEPWKSACKQKTGQ
jgi:hypothetical protein